MADSISPDDFHFDQAAYLAFLHKRLPDDLDARLWAAGGIELRRDPFLRREDVTSPLTTGQFVTGRSKECMRLVWSLQFLLIGSEVERTGDDVTDDDYVELYVASYYLYACCWSTTFAGSFVESLDILMLSMKLDPDARLHIIRFVGALVSRAEAVTSSVETPRAITSLALTAMAADFFSQCCSLSLRMCAADSYPKAWHERLRELAFIDAERHLTDDPNEENLSTASLRKLSNRLETVLGPTSELLHRIEALRTAARCDAGK